MAGGAARIGNTVRLDALCVAAIVVLSALPYVGQLGFYSDDWSLLAALHFGSIDGVSLLDPEAFAVRPLHGYYLLLLYHAFGLDPLGYHLVNLAVIAGAVVLLYLLLVRVEIGRSQAFAVAAIFAILPQLSTVRVWVAASQIPLSLLFMLLSAHAQLSFARSGRAAWLGAALAAAVLSLAAYEIFAPLILAFALWLAIANARSGRASGFNRRKMLLLGAGVAAVVGAVVLFKLAVSDRGPPPLDLDLYLRGLRQLVRLDYDWRTDSSLNFGAALDVHFWRTIEGWGAALGWALDGAALSAIVCSAAVAAVTAWRLLVRGSTGEANAGVVRLLLIGAVTFVVGHATFLIVPWILFAPTGLANRMLVAAAIGVAVLFVAAVAAVAKLAGSRSSFTFAVLVALVGGVGALRTAQIASFWAAAPDRQTEILNAARADLRQLEAGSTVILDNICPYIGPAPVFETSWEVGGALSLALGRQISGDVVTPRMAVNGNGLLTSMYDVPQFYPYGPRLYVCDPSRRRLAALSDLAAARAYFADPARSPALCPPTYEGHGVLLRGAAGA